MADDIFDNIKIRFEQFLSLVGNVLAHEKEIHIIKNKIRRHFNSTSSSYLCSTNFRSLLNHIHNLFNENDKSTKYFTLLSAFDEQLKKHSIKLLGSHRSSDEASTSICNTESIKKISSTNETTVITSDKSSLAISIKSLSSTIDEHNTSSSSIEQTNDQFLNSCDNIFFALNESPLTITNKESTMTSNSINTSEIEMKRKKKINKLERKLSSLSKTIHELEEKDMSLDEMRYCDLYLIESNLKKQAYEIYNKLAQLKNQSSSIERILDQPVTLTQTEVDHPLINKALEDMVNQTKFLPSFSDILDTVEKTNDKYKLNLSIDVRKNLAENSFKIIGKKVKDRRIADFNDIMSSRLPENFDIERNDPALDNDAFEKTLLENEREAVSKTEKILEEFSQIDPDLIPVINIESSEDSAAENDEEGKDEEEEEEDNDDDDDEVESESDANVELFDNKPDENHYDIVDILPPFSPKSSSPPPSNVTKTINSKDPVEATVKIPVSDRRLTILSTASVPVKRAAHNPFVSMIQKAGQELYTLLQDNDIQELQPFSIIQERHIHTIIPRRRQQYISTNSANETLLNIYKQRITTNNLTTAATKRSSQDIESSKSKKPKEIPEIVILD